MMGTSAIRPSRLFPIAVPIPTPSNTAWMTRSGSSNDAAPWGPTVSDLRTRNPREADPFLCVLIERALCVSDRASLCWSTGMKRRSRPQRKISQAKPVVHGSSVHGLDCCHACSHSSATCFEGSQPAGIMFFWASDADFSTMALQTFQITTALSSGEHLAM